MDGSDEDRDSILESCPKKIFFMLVFQSNMSDLRRL